MWLKVLVVLAVVGLAVLISWVGRPRGGGGPAKATFQVPSHVDLARLRADMGVAAVTPWLVLVLTSNTCDSCEAVVQKARPLESDAVTVAVASFQDHPQIHATLGVDAVPLTLLVDEDGEVRRFFSGPVTSSDLWGAMADLRD